MTPWVVSTFVVVLMFCLVRLVEPVGAAPFLALLAVPLVLPDRR